MSWLGEREPITQEDILFGAVVKAARDLIADVRRRYPGEELRCEHMRALDAALTALSKL